MNRKPPLLIYIGLNVHATTHSKKVISRLYELGISIRYEQTLELENWVTAAVLKV